MGIPAREVCTGRLDPLDVARVYTIGKSRGQGRPDEGILQAREGVAEYSASGNRLAIGVFLGFLAEAEARAQYACSIVGGCGSNILITVRGYRDLS